MGGRYYYQRKLGSNTHNADSRRESNPAQLPPNGRVVANHLVDAVIEAVDAKRPGYGDTLEEDEKQQAESGNSVRVEDLEHVHSTLRKEFKITFRSISLPYS